LYIFHLLDMYCFIDTFCDDVFGVVMLGGVVRIIFEELDPIWLARM
jgi:hypothetical protein